MQTRAEMKTLSRIADVWRSVFPPKCRHVWHTEEQYMEKFIDLVWFRTKRQVEEFGWAVTHVRRDHTCTVCGQKWTETVKLS